MRSIELVILAVIFLGAPCLQVHAGLPDKVAAEVLERVVEAAARTSGKPVIPLAAKKAAAKEVEALAAKHGPAVLQVVQDGGLELLEGAAKYGDEVMQMAGTATSPGRRALALDTATMLPLARKYGVEALEAEAKAPGQATRLFEVFGADEGRRLATEVGSSDLPRLIRYAEKSDDAVTRRMLVDAYRKEGSGLFARIPPRVILDTGLTAAMLVGTHRMTAPFIAIAEVLRAHPVLAATVALLTSIFLGAMLLWRFRLMRWHRSTSPSREDNGTVIQQ